MHVQVYVHTSASIPFDFSTVPDNEKYTNGPSYMIKAGDRHYIIFESYMSVTH